MKHVPVLLDEVMDALAPRADGIYLDGTFGGGGYARRILASGCTLYAIDRDPAAIARGAELLREFPGQLHLLQGSFGDMVALLALENITSLAGIVLDLGVSYFQLDDPARGFSFRLDGPLDMRMSLHGPTAADLVNNLPEEELAAILYQFGEERASRRIAKAIVARRAETPFTTTLELARVIRSVLPPDRSGIDPATRSFQALHIKVNDEMGEIERALEAASSLLAPGGRLVVVSFHSGEDRIVKQFMTRASGREPAPSRHDPGGLLHRAAPQFRLVGNKLVRPGQSEISANARARSSRLRAMERIPAGDNIAERRA